jgi:hypothetical protein
VVIDARLARWWSTAMLGQLENARLMIASTNAIVLHLQQSAALGANAMIT